MIGPKQKNVLSIISLLQKKNGFSPSLKEISKKLKVKSVSTVDFHLRKLQEAGYLAKEKGKWRTIELFDFEKFVQIPFLGLISAGKLMETYSSDRGTIAIPQNKVPKTGNMFALRVSGDSMIEENIHNGDVVLMKEQKTADSGQKVVALVDNYETTLKTYYKEKNRIVLKPANKDLEPIIITKDRLFEIQGVVVDVIKNNEKIPVSQEISKRLNRLPLNKIILNDAVEELKKLPDDSCDVIIIDPPYNIGKDFGNNIDRREFGEYIRWSKSWIDQAIRVLKPTGTLFIYGFSEILAYLSVEIPINKRWLIWHYTNKNVASLNFWQRSHESIICAWKDRPIFNKDSVREPYTEGFLNGAAGKIRKATAGRYSSGGQETVYKAHEGGALPRDVLKIPALAGGAGMNERWFICKTCDGVFAPRELKKHLDHITEKHPTQKPLELCRKLIKSAMPEKDGVVLVPFVGSGAECAAAKELGYNYIGFEINPDYVRIAEKAIASVK